MAMRGEALAQQRAHEDGEHDGLYGNAFAEAGMKVGVALGLSDEPPETSIEALPTTTRRELGTPLPAGNTPAKLASAPRPPAPIRPWAESTEAEWLAIAAKILYAGSNSSSDGASEVAAKTSVDLTSWQDSDLDLFDVDPSDATGCAGRLEDAPQALAPIVEETAGGIAALAPAGAGAGAARELGVSTPIGPLAATVSSRRALLLPATWATPPAPAQLHSSSCAFPASSMSPGGVCEISSDEIAFAGDTLEECGFASNCYDSPGRGGADGTGAKEPNYVPDKANQDQKPGGFSLATGRPPGDTAAGALSTGKLESGRGLPGGAAAGAISAGAPKLECTGRPPGGAAAAGALSAGAIKRASLPGCRARRAVWAPRPPPPPPRRKPQSRGRTRPRRAHVRA